MPLQLTEIIQLGSTVTTVVIFIWHIQKTGDAVHKMLYDLFGSFIRSQKELTEKMQMFSDASHEHTETLKEHKDVLQKMYVELLKQRDPKTYRKVIKKIKT